MYSFKDEHSNYFYEKARRFDESKIMHDKEYGRILDRRFKIIDRIVEKYGNEILELVVEYGDTFFQEMELSARSLYMEGCSDTFELIKKKKIK